MRFKWMLLICLLVSSIVKAQQAPPVLFFSDLIFGPNTGWNNGSSQGAAVTIWGENFGATRGSSYVTIGGAQATTYAEWDAIGPARGLERITFYIPTGASVGAGTISVTVNGVTSNTLPFTVDNTTPIYYIDVNTGNNSNNGRTTSTAFKDIWKFNPCSPGDPHHSQNCNPSMDGQYIAYVRAGTYTTLDPDGGAFVRVYGATGGPTKQKALIGYPGETPILSMASSSEVIYSANFSPYGFNDYYTIAKLSTGTTTATGGNLFFDLVGNNNRIIGNISSHQNAYAQAGVIHLNGSKYISIYGNLEDTDGQSTDRMKHGIYAKTELLGMPQDASHDIATQHIDIGWNEFKDFFADGGWAGVIFLSKASDAGNYYTDYIYIHHNYFHGGNDVYSYVADGTNLNDHLYYYGNIFAPHTQTTCIYYNIGTQQIMLFNNVFYQCGSSTLDYVDYTSHPTFNNNIYWPVTGGSVFTLDDLSYNPVAISDHELFWNGTTPASSPPSLIVTNPTNGNPQFTNAANNDFHIGSTSAARGVGNNLSSTVTTNSLPWGNYDYDGVAYPASGAWDAGALQYATAAVVSRPNPPTNLTVTVN